MVRRYEISSNCVECERRRLKRQEKGVSWFLRIIPGLEDRKGGYAVRKYSESRENYQGLEGKLLAEISREDGKLDLEKIARIRCKEKILQARGVDRSHEWLEKHDKRHEKVKRVIYPRFMDAMESLLAKQNWVLAKTLSPLQKKKGKQNPSNGEHENGKVNACFRWKVPEGNQCCTSKPIGSMFATIRLGTKRMRNCGNRSTNLAMLSKLFQGAQKGWKRLRGCKQIHQVLDEKNFRNGASFEESAEKWPAIRIRPFLPRATTLEKNGVQCTSRNPSAPRKLSPLFQKKGKKLFSKTIWGFLVQFFGTIIGSSISVPLQFKLGVYIYSLEVSI